MSFLEPEGEGITSKDVIQINDLNQIGPYKLVKTLGKGSYAVVKLGIHEETGEKVAVKIIRKSLTSNGKKLQKQADRIHREVSILKMLDHPNIVKLLNFIEISGFYVLIMEYVAGKTLYRVLRKSIKLTHADNVDGLIDGRKMGISGCGLPEDQVFRIFYQMVSALEYCHCYGISHRDIKPENVLIDEATGNLKLSDFGLANLVPHDQFMETHCGSPYYAAPEIVRGEKYKGPAADVWSLGICLFVMGTGKLPFLHESLSKVMELISDGTYHIPPDVDFCLSDLIERMLHPIYSQRISLRQLKNQPWWLKNCMILNLDPVGICSTAPVIAVPSLPSRPGFPASNTAPVLEDLVTTSLRRAIQNDPLVRRRFFSSPNGKISANNFTGSSPASGASNTPRSPLSDENLQDEDSKTKLKTKISLKMRSLLESLRDKLCGKSPRVHTRAITP